MFTLFGLLAHIIMNGVVIDMLIDLSKKLTIANGKKVVRIVGFVLVILVAALLALSYTKYEVGDEKSFFELYYGDRFECTASSA